MEERLQKILARAGYGSRRASEELISQKRVTINGKPAILGSKADPAVDRIEVDGKPLKLDEKLVYIALNKPRGVISAASSPDRRNTVRDLVPAELGQIYPVGRLDVDSEGLILLTNDGELTNRLTHPRYGHEKEYQVLVARHPDPDQLNAWRRGVVMDDGYKTAPAEVYVVEPFGKGAWLRVILREGRKRQIREVGSQLGLPVVRILRTRIGSLKLGSLKSGDFRHLTEAEVKALRGETLPPRMQSRRSPHADPPSTRAPRRPSSEGHTAESKPRRGSRTSPSERTGPASRPARARTRPPSEPGFKRRPPRNPTRKR